MRPLKKLIGLAAVIGLAYILFTQFGPQASQSPGQQLESAQVRAAEAQRINVADPVQLSLAPRPGDRWRQTSVFQGQVMQRDFFNADTVTPGEMRWVTEVQARAGEETGEVILEHRATDVTGRDDLSQIHPRLHEQLRQEAREREAVLARSSYVESLDSRGEPQDVLAYLDFGPGNGSEYVIDPFLLALLSTPTGLPDGPLTEGTTWAVERPLIYHEDLSVLISSTLDHFEEIDGQRVAVIHSEIECHPEEPSELFIQSSPDGVSTRVIRERLNMSWSQEAHHRLSDGRRLMSTGQFDFNILARIENGQVTAGQEQMVLAGAQPGKPQIHHQELGFRFEFATETEPIR